jgi:hypothetical protein
MPQETPSTEIQPGGMDATSIKLILDGLNVLKQHASNSIAFQARMDEKMTAMDGKLTRVEKVLFGNGDPGVGEQLRAHDKRLTEVEATETKCAINQILPFIDDMKERHEKEDATAQKQEQIQVQKVTDQRKFYYAMGTTIVAAVVDIVVHLLK